MVLGRESALSIVKFGVGSHTGHILVMTDAALPSATNHANKQLIDTLLRSRLFRDYESVFTKATGLALALRPLEYWQLEHRQKTNENRFCALLAQRPATLAVCLQSHAEIIRHTGTTPRTETCPFGLTETAVPVRLGEETIGFLRIGQVLRRSAIQSDKTRAAAKLAECGVPFTGGIRKAWETTPIIPKDKYGAIVRLLTIFCRATLGPHQPNRARETERRAAPGAQGARIHRATQNGAAFIGGRRASIRRERVSLLQSLQENDWLEVYRLRWPGAIGRRQNAALESESPH